MGIRILCRWRSRKRIFNRRILFGTTLCLSLSIFLLFVLNLLLLGREGFMEKVSNGNFLDILMPWRKSVNMDANFEFEESLSGGKCVIPKIDPFREEAMKHVKTLKKLECPGNYFGQVKGGKLYIKTKGMLSGYIQYIRRPDGDDFHVHISDKIILEKPLLETDIIFDAEEEFVKLVINNGGEKELVEYHILLVADKKILSQEKKEPKGLGLNVALIMFDSQSTANFERTMPKSLKLLRARQGTIQLKGNSIVGDGTTAQLCAMLTGYNEHFLPDARREHKGSKSVDEWPFIFKDLKHEGYVTLFLEDHAMFSSFQYRLHGFQTQPTDHYSRPFFIQIDSHYKNTLLCIGPKSKHNISLEYTTEFFDKYPMIPKFSFTEINVVCHDSMNNMQMVDDDLAGFLEDFDRKGHLDNTMVVIFGDHGPRVSEFRGSINGKMEERLPYTSLTFPDWFVEKHKDLFDTVKYNSEILTSHFDMYHTLKHILSYPELPKKTQAGQSLFTKIDVETRTCASAGIPDHFCPCLQFKAIDPQDSKVQSLAELAVQHMNKHVASFSKPKELCETLRLDKVGRAGKRRPNWKVEQFSFSRRNSRCDSCILIFDKKLKDVHSHQYEIVLSVQPGGGMFEISIKINHDRIEIDPDISRINRYGDQPKCIASEYPNLRKYCYCKKPD